MKGVPLNEELYNYIVDTFAKEDDILSSVVTEASKKNFPLIQVSPENGKFLQLLIRMISAKKVLEIGTLTGYSAIWMARGLPEGGRLITIEMNVGHAEEARNNFRKANLEDKIEVIVSDALKALKDLSGSVFDFVFIDADKVSYPAYFDMTIGMMKRGGIICADNTLRDGDVINLETTDEGTKAVRAFNKKVASDPRVSSLLCLVLTDDDVRLIPHEQVLG